MILQVSALLLKTVRETIGLLRLTPFDTSTEEGRSQERNRRIAWTSVTAAIAKGISVFVLLVSIPLTLGYLGPERFGLWMAIVATIAMLGFADFGLGNGMMNAVAHASGNGADENVRRIVSNGILMLSLIGVAVAALFATVYSSITWSALFNVSTSLAASEAGPVVLVLVACFAANLPVGATQKVQLGLQRGYWASGWEAVGSLMSLAGIIAAIHLQAGLQWIALAMAGIPVIFRALNTLVFFGWQKPSLRPMWNRFDFSMVRRLLRTGALFFMLQLAMLVAFQSDYIIIAKLLGAESVASYDIVLKLCSLPAMFMSFIIIAQWPAYGEASVRGDVLWIRRTFLKTLQLSLAVTVPFALVLFLFGGKIIELWAGPDVIPSTSLLAGMSIWSVLVVVGSVAAALLNGLHVVGFQAVSSVLMATSNVLISIYLVQQIGVTGAILGSILAYVTLTLIPYWYYIRRRLLHVSADAVESSSA